MRVTLVAPSGRPTSARLARQLGDRLAARQPVEVIAADALRVRHASTASDLVVCFTACDVLAAADAMSGAALALAPAAEIEPSGEGAQLEAAIRRVDAVAFLTVEERAVVERAVDLNSVLADVTGLGADVDAAADPERFRAAHRDAIADRPLLVHLGAVGRETHRLLGWFMRLREEMWQTPAVLALCPDEPIAGLDHPDVLQLVATDAVDAIVAARAVLVGWPPTAIPSALLSSWSAGTPVVVDGRSAVLPGLCRRSGGGLYCSDWPEFREVVRRLLAEAPLATALGESGRTWVRTSCAWDAVAARWLALARGACARSAKRGPTAAALAREA